MANQSHQLDKSGREHFLKASDKVLNSEAVVWHECLWYAVFYHLICFSGIGWDNVIFPLFQNKQHNSCCNNIRCGKDLYVRKPHLWKQRLHAPKNDAMNCMFPWWTDNFSFFPPCCRSTTRKTWFDPINPIYWLFFLRFMSKHVLTCKCWKILYMSLKVEKISNSNI